MNWRIHLQPALTAANCLPPPSLQPKDTGSEQATVEGKAADGREGDAEAQLLDARGLALAHVDHALDALLQLDEQLAASNPQLQDRPRWRKREREDSEKGKGGEDGGHRQGGESASRLAVHLRSAFSAFRPYRNSLLDAWQEKTARAVGSRIAGGTSGAEAARQDDGANTAVLASSRPATSSSSDSSLIRRALSVQLEELLRDRAALRRRTQLQRGAYRLIGHTSHSIASASTVAAGTAPSDDSELAPLQALRGSALRRLLSVPVPHVFDDLDFYSATLQDVISASDAGEADGRRLAEQRLLAASASQARRALRTAVDRRASKGRKLRYAVISRLQHFMAPASAEQTEGRGEAASAAQSQLAIDQLYAHLFGHTAVLHTATD